MNQCLYLTLLLAVLGSYVWGERVFNSVLTVPNGGPWGDWGKTEMCPEGFYAAGFSLQVEYPIIGDNTALNGVRLHCIDTPGGKTTSSKYATVKSATGSWGVWTATKWCKSGLLMNFALRVEGSRRGLDDTAANNIMFQCSGYEMAFVGAGTSWGNWGAWSEWCAGTGICGIQTKVEGPQGKGDDTALNDVKLYCCD